MHVLLIEDDEILGDGLVAGLKINGFEVEWVQDGSSASALLLDGHFDLLVLDLGLPRMDGIDVLREVRRKHITIPCLIITARDAVGDRVEGLDAGADDYLCKPFALDEFCARLRALYRRPSKLREETLRYGDLVLDPAAHSCSIAGQTLNLPRREFALLECLMQQPDRVYTREELEARLYAWDDDISSNALEVHIHGLRSKLGKSAVRTVRGVGYTLSPS